MNTCKEVLKEKFTPKGFPVVEIPCGGEMILKCQIDNYGLGLEVQKLYQCKSCKNIETL